jgi:predicted phage gp36 major capsid-like protein
VSTNTTTRAELIERLIALEDRVADIVSDMRSMVDLVEAENRPMSEKEISEFHELSAKHAQIGAELKDARTDLIRMAGCK